MAFSSIPQCPSNTAFFLCAVNITTSSVLGRLLKDMAGQRVSIGSFFAHGRRIRVGASTSHHQPAEHRDRNVDFVIANISRFLRRRGFIPSELSKTTI